MNVNSHMFQQTVYPSVVCPILRNFPETDISAKGLTLWNSLSPNLKLIHLEDDEDINPHKAKRSV